MCSKGGYCKDYKAYVLLRAYRQMVQHMGYSKHYELFSERETQSNTLAHL